MATAHSNDDEAVLGYRDAAKFLGISERTLERYVHEGRVPYIQLPKRGAWAGVRFMRSQLLHWLEQRTIKPSNRTNGNARSAR
jgi:excisionase family DNA binding protein